MQVVLLSVLIGLVLGAFLFYVLSSWTRGKQEIQSAVPRFSEKDAEAILRKAGFSILGKHQKETIITNIDGKDHFGYVEADYTVKKDRRSYAVVVHSGEGSADPNEPNFRRVLLEHNRAFSGDGILVLDLNKGELHEVYFRFPHERNIDFFFRFLSGLFIVLLVIGIIWLLVTLKLF